MTIATLPHIDFEFLEESSKIVNLMFAGFLGGSIGIVLYTVISEIISYLRD